MTVGTDPMVKAEHTNNDDDASQYNSAFNGSMTPERTSVIPSITLTENNSTNNENVSVCQETRARRLSLSIFPRDRDDVILNFKEKVEQCNAHLVKCATQVATLKGLIIKDLSNLDFVVHEPELWQRLVNFFHEKLNSNFINMPIRSLMCCCKSITVKLCFSVSYRPPIQFVLKSIFTCFHLCVRNFFTDAWLFISLSNCFIEIF